MTVIALANTDVELQRRIANFLYQHRVPGIECIQLNVYGGVVAVSGRIPTRYARWLCIESCRRVPGVLRVIDNVKIEPAVSEQLPMANHIFGEIAKCRRHRHDKYAICLDRRSVLLKRTLTACKCPKLMVAA